MKEKEFGSFFQEGHQLFQLGHRTFSHEKIIKDEQVKKTAQIKSFMPGEFENHSPEIFFIEKDGQVSEILFKCPCGSQASVELVPDSTPRPETREKETVFEEAVLDA